MAPLQAADEHKHDGKKHDHEEKKVDVTVPEGAGALWAEIDAKHKALSQVMASKKMDGLHVAAESVKLLTAVVPAKYADLAPDKKKRVEGQAKNIARVLDDLHEEGEEGHWDNVAKKLTQLEAALKIMKEQLTPRSKTRTLPGSRVRGIVSELLRVQPSLSYAQSTQRT